MNATHIPCAAVAIFYAIMTIHVPTNLAGTNNKAHTGTDK